MLAVVALAVFIGALAALAAPLLRRPRTAVGATSGEEPAGGTAGASASLLEEREGALAALRELEFDYSTGKLAEADYYSLRSGYERRALLLLRATDPAAPGRTDTRLVPHRTDAVARIPGAVYRNGFAPGTGQSGPAPRSTGDARRTALAAGSLAVLFIVAVTAVYVMGNRGQSDHGPVATVEGVGPRALAFSPSEPGRVFLAAAAGLLTSTDAGSRWQPVQSLDRALRAVAASPARPGRLYAAGPDALLSSDDGGQTWATRRVALTEGGDQAGVAPDVRALAVDPANGERLWIVAEGNGLFRSDDGGQTWVRTAATVPANATALAADGAAGSGGGPGDAPLLYLSSATEGVVASGDEGRTWVQASGAVNGALPTRRVSSLAFDAASGDTAALPDGRTVRGTLYAATEDGVFRSLDRGGSWARLSLSVPVAAVAAASAGGTSTLLAADREGSIYRSRNRGVTWDGS